MSESSIWCDRCGQVLVCDVSEEKMKGQVLCVECETRVAMLQERRNKEREAWGDLGRGFNGLPLKEKEE